MRLTKFREHLASSTAMSAELPRSAEDEIFVPYPELQKHGIPYCRVHLRRMIRAGTFPAPHQLSPNRCAWKLSDLVRWKSTRPIAGSAVAEEKESAPA
jgi:predicted DNA-binding transcriptional regulator AlpA